MGQQQSLQKSGSVGGLLQYPKRVGITKEGPISQSEIQKKKGLRLREEGSNISRDTLRRSPGLLRGGRGGPKPKHLSRYLQGSKPKK